MEDVSFSLLNVDENLIQKLEDIRFSAYDMNNSLALSSFYAHCLRTGCYVVYGVFYKNDLAGACYVSMTFDSLYIEQLFIVKQYQRSSLHLGSKLLEYILSQKEYIESYFNTSFKYSYLDNATSNSHIYEKIGYKSTKSLLMRKKL